MICYRGPALHHHNQYPDIIYSMSPTVFKDSGYRFFFFSREEERMHVHIISGDGEAKYWLEPEIELAKNHRYTRKQLKQIESLIESRYDELTNAWQQHFKR